MLPKPTEGLTWEHRPPQRYQPEAIPHLSPIDLAGHLQTPPPTYETNRGNVLPSSTATNGVNAYRQRYKLCRAI